MLDTNCKDDSLDGCSVPRVQDGFLHARCVCGLERRVPIDSVANQPGCSGCGASIGDGLIQGPDRVAIMRLMQKPRPPADDSDNVVYFARVGNLVKIGTTGDLWTRMANLGKPELLGVLPGGYAVEREHHQLFADDRVHGEVFHASPRLLAYIADHCTQPQPPDPRPRPTGDTDWKPPGWMHNQP
jgi:hypothetical protein